MSAQTNIKKIGKEMEQEKWSNNRPVYAVELNTDKYKSVSKIWYT